MTIARPNCGHIPPQDSTKLDIQIYPIETSDPNQNLKDKLEIQIIQIDQFQNQQFSQNLSDEFKKLASEKPSQKQKLALKLRPPSDNTKNSQQQQDNKQQQQELVDSKITSSMYSMQSQGSKITKNNLSNIQEEESPEKQRQSQQQQQSEIKQEIKPENYLSPLQQQQSYQQQQQQTSKQKYEKAKADLHQTQTEITKDKYQISELKKVKERQDELLKKISLEVKENTEGKQSSGYSLFQCGISFILALLISSYIARINV